MKTIYLLRHAKSSWGDENLADFDRPLDKSGIDTMPSLGEKICENRFQIETILSSPAKRTKQTATLLKEAAQLDAEIHYNEKIYEASPHRLLEIIGEIENNKNSVMLIGHNPGLEGLIRILTDERQTMETASLAVIDLHIQHWNETCFGCGKVRQMINPKLD